MRLRFTTRDVFWLMLVVVLAVGWCVERSRLFDQLHRAEAWQREIEAELARQTKENETWRSHYSHEIRYFYGKSNPQSLDVPADWLRQ